MPSHSADHSYPSGDDSAYLKIHIVEIYVRDQDASISFYRDRLGFEVVVDTGPQEWGRWVAVAPPIYETAVLALMERPDDIPAPGTGRRTGVTLVTDDIAAKFEEWSCNGVRFPQSPRPVPYGFQATFEDPDGNRFNLVQNPQMVEILNAHRRAIEERKESERRAAVEADVARKVQARLFPQAFPPMKTLEYAAACIPAQHVGGDYYDLMEMRPGRIGLVVADISGKGVSAALLMANLQANLRSHCATLADSLPRLLNSVNRLFYWNTEPASYATMFICDYDDSSRTLRYANCGHVPPLLLRADGHVDTLLPTSTVVGLFEAWECQTARTRLNAGDTIVLYSDGIVEAERPDGEPFGEERLIEALRRHRGRSAQELVRAIVETTLEFSGGAQQDDITLVAARGLPDSGAGS